MIRLLCAACLLLLAAFSGAATVRALWPEVGVCYSTNGTLVETTYLSGGGEFYPVQTDSSVIQIDDGFMTVHRVRWERHGVRVYLPVVGR